MRVVGGGYHGEVSSRVDAAKGLEGVRGTAVWAWFALRKHCPKSNSVDDWRVVDCSNGPSCRRFRAGQGAGQCRENRHIKHGTIA